MATTYLRQGSRAIDPKPGIGHTVRVPFVYEHPEKGSFDLYYDWEKHSIGEAHRILSSPMGSNSMCAKDSSRRCKTSSW